MMKKRFLFVVSLLTMGALVACSGVNDIIPKNSSDDSADSQDSSEDAINLPNSIEQSANKLMELGKTKGFEITYLVDSDDEESSGPESDTVGF